MSRLVLMFSEDLNKDIDKELESSRTPKDEFIRRALVLYLEAKKGQREGLKLGLADNETNELKREFVDL